MIINNGKQRPVISTLQQMAMLNARWTRGDIAIDQLGRKIYFCTVPIGIDVPLGISTEHANFQLYFTPYNSSSVEVDGIEGVTPYNLMTTGDVESLLSGELTKDKLESFKYKVLTPQALAAIISENHIGGIQADGSYLVVDSNNYKELINEPFLKRNCNLMIGTWKAPITQDEDEDRNFFVPRDISVTETDTAMLRIFKSGSGDNIKIIREFIMYRFHSAENYCIRYLSSNGGEWKNITSIDSANYAQKSKELFDRNVAVWKLLRSKYDRVNQVYVHKFRQTEIPKLEELDKDYTLSIIQDQGKDMLILNLSNFRNEIILNLQDEVGDVEIKPEFIQDILVRANITNAVEEDGKPVGIVSSVMLNVRTLLSGVVNWITSGNFFYQVRQTEEVGTYIVFPIDDFPTEITMETIPNLIDIYIMNIKLVDNL